MKNVRVCMYACVYVCMYVCMCMYVCVYVCSYVCMYVCMYVGCVCMYVYLLVFPHPREQNVYSKLESSLYVKNEGFIVSYTHAHCLEGVVSFSVEKQV